MTRKLMTYATAQDADEASRAIFEQWRKDVLAQTGGTELDCDLRGNPLPKQITTRYVAPPPDILDPQTLQVITPSDPRALLIDDVVEAMQGKKIAVPGGKEITIDVSAAKPWAGATPVGEPTTPPTMLARVVSASAPAAGAGATVATGLAVAGFGPTIIAAGGAAAALVVGAVAFFKSAGE